MVSAHPPLCVREPRNLTPSRTPPPAHPVTITKMSAGSGSARQGDGDDLLFLVGCSIPWTSADTVPSGLPLSSSAVMALVSNSVFCGWANWGLRGHEMITEEKEEEEEEYLSQGVAMEAFEVEGEEEEELYLVEHNWDIEGDEDNEEAETPATPTAMIAASAAVATTETTVAVTANPLVPTIIASDPD